jgi:hypothetical protein
MGGAFCNIPQHGHLIFSKTVRLRESISGDTVSKQTISIASASGSRVNRCDNVSP